MQRPGDQRRRGRGPRDPAGSPAAMAAVAAKEGAASAFYEMDQVQRFVTGRVTVFADLDPKGAAPAQARLEALTRTADSVSAAYITLVDAHDLDGPPRSPAEYDAARRAFLGVTERLTATTADFNAFAAALAPQMDRLEAALDELPARLTTARQMIAEAEAAVAAARDMHPDEPAADLAAARAAMELLGSKGLGGLGLAGALSKAEEVRLLAEKARDAALELPRLGDKVRHDLVAIRTRVQVVAGRAEPVAEAMRQLRRRYSQECWKDLAGAERLIDDAVVRARERIGEAEAAASRQDWAASRRALTAARTELNAADRRAGTVTGRVADLDAAVADPGRAAEAARFAVRDAQKLAMSGHGGVSSLPPQHARTLDGLVARLEAAQGALRVPRPDYWAYLRELDAIKSAAQDVITMIRSERAREHRP